MTEISPDGDVTAARMAATSPDQDEENVRLSDFIW